MRSISLMTAGSVLVLSALALPVMAQSQQVAQSNEPSPEQGVEQRSPSEYEPLGIRAGSFLIFPKAEVGEEYNSNIFKADSGEKDDFITTLSPSLAVRSDWSRHSLDVSGGVDAGFYASNSDDNFVDYNARIRGRADATRALQFNGDARYRHLHEERGGDDVATDASEPVEYDRFTGEFGGRYKPNRFSVEAKASADHYDYDDNSQIGGGTSNNDDRDRTVYVEGVRFGYEIQPGYEAFVRGELNQREYDDSTDDNGFNRDSDGYKVQGGIAIELTRLLRADIGVGYLEQNYDDSALDDASGISADARVRWNVTRLTTVRGTLARTVSETTSTDVSGTFNTNITLGIEHELMRNLILTADARYGLTEYEGDPNDREDDKFGFGAGARYKLNRNLYANLSYSYDNRDSNINTNDYDQHRVMLRLGAQF